MAIQIENRRAVVELPIEADLAEESKAIDRILYEEMELRSMTVFRVIDLEVV